MGDLINKIRNMGTQRLLNLLTGIIFSIFTVLIIRYQINLLTYCEWGDESENAKFYVINKSNFLMKFPKEIKYFLWEKYILKEKSRKEIYFKNSQGIVFINPHSHYPSQI